MSLHLPEYLIIKFLWIQIFSLEWYSGICYDFDLRYDAMGCLVRYRTVGMSA